MIDGADGNVIIHCQLNKHMRCCLKCLLGSSQWLAKTKTKGGFEDSAEEK